MGTFAGEELQVPKGIHDSKQVARTTDTQVLSQRLGWAIPPFLPDPTPPHPESSHRRSQAAPGPFRAWGARGSGVSRGAHLTQLSLVALGTLQQEERQLSPGPWREMGKRKTDTGRSWQERVEGSYLGPGPALLALLPWFSFGTLKGEEGKEKDEE